MIERILASSLSALCVVYAAGEISAHAADAKMKPSSGSPSQRRPVYPDSPRRDHVDYYAGNAVNDPYRWLENPDSPESREWIEAQNKVTFGYLENIPARQALKERLTALWNFERFGVPFQYGGRYFYTRNDGLQNQSVLFTAASISSEPAVLLDPNTLSPDGTVALSGMDFSEDGNLMAYGISVAGSDWQEWKVRDVKTAKDLPDIIKWVKFSSASWSKDSKGFYYSRYDEPGGSNQLRTVNEFQKLYYHRLGAPQSEDALIYHRADHGNWGFGGEVTEDGQYLIIGVSRGTDTKNAVFFKDLSRAENPVVELLKDFDASYSFVANDGPLFWFFTDWRAPRGKLIAIDIRSPERENWKEVIPQKAASLKSVHRVNDQWIAVYLDDAHSKIQFFAKDGAYLRDLALPGLGSAGGFAGRQKDKETFYSYQSFTTPSVIYRLDMVSGQSSVFRQPKVGFDSDRYITEQVFYPSKDGVRVPMFITHRKGLKLDGQNPVYLYGYGGFNISLTPSFSIPILVWLEMGGVYAMPSLRGGGEYGEEWHQAGMKQNKQHVFDDFIAAGEWLVANKYTRPEKLAIGGGSNGGLLVGACMTQRPDLFGAALPAVGVMDMLRFDKFTIGWAWTSEYGVPANAHDFKTLLAYSPLHNLKPGTHYPATMIVTADHDDRVVPAHSFKFAAALQQAHTGKAPVLIRIDTKAGHGAGKPTAKQIEEAADKWAFLTSVLKMSPLKPEKTGK
jgi:prolyl oligopeptidase